MVTLKQYKNHLIEAYRYEEDNTPTKRQERKELLESQYSDEDLTNIINSTYTFIKVLLNNTDPDFLECYSGSGWDIDLKENATSYISLIRSQHADTLYRDDNGRIISEYVIKQFFGNYFYIDVEEDEYKREKDGEVSFETRYRLHMDGIPKKIGKYKGEINLLTEEPKNVLFIDFDGVIYGMHDERGNYELVEKRIAILADICKEYNCKVVISSGGKGAIDEYTMEPFTDWIKNIFELFKKYGIDCIGRTPNVEKKTGPNSCIPSWKEDEIRLYLLRHPEIEHYCVLDDNDTVRMFHWKRSDLEKVSDHLVEIDYYAPSEDPKDEGLLPKHKEQIGEVLKKDNEIRRLVLKRRNLDY